MRYGIQFCSAAKHRERRVINGGRAANGSALGSSAQSAANRYSKMIEDLDTVAGKRCAALMQRHDRIRASALFHWWPRPGQRSSLTLPSRSGSSTTVTTSWRLFASTAYPCSDCQDRLR